MGNDNEARRHVIISRLPNRSAPKKQLRVQLARNLFPVPCRVSEASCGKIEIINDRQRGWTAAQLLAALVVIGGVGGWWCYPHICHATPISLTHTNNKDWKRSQSLLELWRGRRNKTDNPLSYSNFIPSKLLSLKVWKTLQKKKGLQRRRAKMVAGCFPS